MSDADTRPSYSTKSWDKRDRAPSVGSTTRGSYYSSSRESSPLRTGSTSRLSRLDYSSPSSKPFEFGVSYTPRLRENYSTSNLTPGYSSRLNRSVSYTDSTPTTYQRQTSNESLGNYDRGSVSHHNTSRDSRGTSSYSKPTTREYTKSRESLANRQSSPRSRESLIVRERPKTLPKPKKVDESSDSCSEPEGGNKDVNVKYVTNRGTDPYVPFLQEKEKRRFGFVNDRKSVSRTKTKRIPKKVYKRWRDRPMLLHRPIKFDEKDFDRQMARLDKMIERHKVGIMFVWSMKPN